MNKSTYIYKFYSSIVQVNIFFLFAYLIKFNDRFKLKLVPTNKNIIQKKKSIKKYIKTVNKRNQRNGR